MGAQILVIGGGITGQLVQFRYPSARVLDWGAPPRDTTKALTRHWGTNYLWEPLEGIPCRSFRVITEVDNAPPTLESIKRYKAKIGKREDGGDWARQFQHQMDGFEIEQMPEATIEYETRILEIQVNEQRVITGKGEVIPYDYLISTIPLNALLELLRPDEIAFELMKLATSTGGAFTCMPIYVRTMTRPPDAPYPPHVLYVNYLSHVDTAPYRFCDRGTTRHYEALNTMGSIPTKKLFPGKLTPPYPETEIVLDSLRSVYNIHAFGRYATWNPEELVHETYRNIVQWTGRL